MDTPFLQGSFPNQSVKTRSIRGIDPTSKKCARSTISRSIRGIYPTSKKGARHLFLFIIIQVRFFADRTEHFSV